MEARKSSKASSLSSISFRLTSINATLNEEEMTMMTQLRNTLNDTITRMMDEVNALQFNIFEVMGAIPSSEQIIGNYFN